MVEAEKTPDEAIGQTKIGSGEKTLKVSEEAREVIGHTQPF
jgi:hypothetical protein